MYLAKEHALRLLEEAATDRNEADRMWRTAIRDAIGSNASLDCIAQHARTTIETIRAISCGEPLPDLFFARTAK